MVCFPNPYFSNTKFDLTLSMTCPWYRCTGNNPSLNERNKSLLLKGSARTKAGNIRGKQAKERFHSPLSPLCEKMSHGEAGRNSSFLIQPQFLPTPANISHLALFGTGIFRRMQYTFATSGEHKVMFS